MYKLWHTVFPHIRPEGIIFLYGLQLRVLLEITKFHLHKSVPGAGIIRNAGIIQGMVLYKEIPYDTKPCCKYKKDCGCLSGSTS